MREPDDHQLLADFARTESEAAFGALVARHLNLVYSTALRFTNNAHYAEEITQAVFIILARKAGKLSPRVVLSGWLYQAARLTAANFMKGEIRRQRREQEAYMQSAPEESHTEAWQEIGPLLDEAMGGLGEADRNALVLRFFQNKTAAEVAAQMKLSEAAAHKRVGRALEKLRKFFTHRGVSSSTAMIAGAISVNSVHAAPVALAKSVTLVAMAKGAAASTSTLTLINGAVKIMAWTKMKMAVVAGAAVLLTAGTYTAIETTIHSHTEMQGKVILAKVIEANRFWLLAPPDSVTNYSYVFHLDWAKAPGGVMHTPVRVTSAQKPSSETRQGITYTSLLQQMARHPDQAHVQSIKEDHGTIRVALKFSYAPGARKTFDAGGQAYPLPPLRIDCGNGIKENWRGEFQTGGTDAELVLDAQKMVPLKTVLKTTEGTVEETFSDYAEAGAGSYVPLRVAIRYAGLPAQFGPMEFAWQFKLHDHGLWLLDQSEYRGKKVCWTDQVVVNQRL